MSNDKDFENDDWNLEEYDINDINDSEDNEYIEENTDIKEENLEATEEEASIENTTHPFANVPVNLSFSLGQLKLSIEEIMQLQEGTVLELEKSTPAQVNIYANGKNIGNGEVVEIDGKIGVQITNLYNN